MALKLGVDAAQKAVKDASSKSFGPVANAVQRADIFTVKEDKASAYIRLLTKNLLVFPFHNYIKDVEGNGRDYACTNHLEGELKRPCWICENLTRKAQNGKTYPMRPSNNILGLAVSKVMNDAKKLVVETKEVDVLSDPKDEKSDSKTIVAPRFLIVKQSNKFWDTIIGYANEFDTLSDRDYKVTRNGKGLDTTYTIIPRDSDKATQEELWAKYKLPEASAEFKDPAVDALYEWVCRRGTPEYFAKLTGEGDTPPAESESAWDSDDSGESESAFSAFKNAAKEQLATTDYD